MAKSKLKGSPKVSKTRRRTSSTPWHKSPSANSLYAFAALAALLALLLILLRGDSPKTPGAKSKGNSKTSSSPVQVKRLWKRVGQGPTRGVVATQDIRAGALIMLDMPFLTIPQTDNTTIASEYLARSLSRLSKSAQAAFFELPYSPNKLEKGSSNERLSTNIFETNAIETDGSHSIFKNACYVKHSCNPNAGIFYRQDLGALLVNAVKDISKGAQVTVPIFDSSVFTREQRQQYLQETYGEVCTCSACSLKGEHLRASDRRRAQLGEIRQLIASWGRGNAEPQDVLPAIEIAYGLLEEEDYKADRGWWAGNAIQVCAAHEDEEGTKKWAKIALPYYSVEAGSDSPQVAMLNTIFENPQRASYWGRRSVQHAETGEEDTIDDDDDDDSSAEDLGETLVEDEPSDEWNGK